MKIFSARHPKNMILGFFFGLLALSLAACGGSNDTAKNTALQPLDYASESRWLCRPDMYSDECRGADLTATELLPDGGSRTVKHVVATGRESFRVTLVELRDKIDIFLSPRSPSTALS